MTKMCEGAASIQRCPHPHKCTLNCQFNDVELPKSGQPPQRTWVGLTNDEVNIFAAGCHLGNSVQGAIYKAEAKLKEKNT